MNRTVPFSYGDEYSMLDFSKQTPKKEYTRSQLIEFGKDVHGQSFGTVENAKNLEKCSIFKLQRKQALNAIEKFNLTDECETDGAKESFNDDFWNRAPNDNGRETIGTDFSQDTLDFTLSNESKVNRWLNTGQNPSKYANANCDFINDPTEISDQTSISPFEFKPSETSSVVTDVSATSARRSKLLEKTAKVKQTLRNLTAHNN